MILGFHILSTHLHTDNYMSRQQSS